MEAKKFNATLEERVSKKGNTYQCIVIKITDKIEKLVFLTPAELELLELKSSVPTFGK